MTSEALAQELTRLWREHGERRLPPIIRGDVEAQALRHDLMAYDSGIASGVLALLDGRQPLRARALDRQYELLERASALAAARPGAAGPALAQYRAYLQALNRLADIAARLLAERAGAPPPHT